MPADDMARDKDARRKFNQQASESVQRHGDDLAHTKRVASDAAQDLGQRQKHRRKRADAMREKKRVA